MHRNPLPTIGFRSSSLLTAVVCVLAMAAAGVARGGPPDTTVPIDKCPALFALGIQGTGESSPDAAVTTDTGMLSEVFRPMMAAASDPGLVDRAYVPYEASFGGATSASTVTYTKSVDEGLDRLRSMAKQVVDRCPSSRLAIAGYSQGAHVASQFAQEVGAGKGTVSAEKVAAVALFGDPNRNANAPLFPGKPDQKLPTAAPGTDGKAVSGLGDPPATKTASGAGIAPDSATLENFGSLVGRVAEFCTEGDLACDTPVGAPLVRTVANIAGQVELSAGDPIGSLKSIAEALAYTSIKTVTSVVNNDVSGTSIADLSYQPQKSISQRIADASNPNTQVDIPGAFQALLKVGTIAINSIVAVVKDILTPANIAEIATAGLANPIAGLAVFGGKLLGAVTNLVPPTTISRLVTQSFSAVTQNITDNKDLLDVTTWVRYWDTAQKHDYTHAQGAGFGESPTDWVGQWFAAVAHDLSGAAQSGGTPLGGSDKPSVGMDFAGTSTAPTSTPPNNQFPLGGSDPTTSPTPTSGTPLFGTSSPPTSGAPLIPNLSPQATP
ncbi:cutinase family protein [Nocardia sp. CDC160]|uniref:cutinase family protein n=1 Tax=Nocardia sp. CDC160 TaxID=3112166 RepID=UPI002DBA770A|nr:cutinase family protein [Nocardia sp. CDC160]MEC3914428.1 cutinase family protein [Nocardia sp. CDC160]